MTSTVDYEDLTRPTTDFFTKPFPSTGLVKIGTETKWTVGEGKVNETLKTTSERKVVKDKQNGLVPQYSVTLEPKFEFKERGLTLEGKLQPSILQSLTLTKEAGSGLKVRVGALLDADKTTKAPQQTATVGVEYQHEKLFLKVNSGIPIESARAYTATGNLVLQPVDNVFVGAKFDFKNHTGKDSRLEKDVEFKLATTAGSTRGHLTATLEKKFGLAVNHTVNDGTVGLQVGVEIPKKPEAKEGKEAEALPTKLSFDAVYAHKVCKSTTVAGKLNVQPAVSKDVSTGIRFGLGTTHTFPGTASSLTLAGDLNVSGLLGSTGHADHSLGFELKLK